MIAFEGFHEWLSHVKAKHNLSHWVATKVANKLSLEYEVQERIMAPRYACLI